MTKSRKLIPTVEARVMPHEYKAHPVYVNHRVLASHVGQYAMELFSHEMTMMEPVSLGASGIASGSSFQPLQRTNIEASVKRACDGAERMFQEMIRRGWLIETPSIDDVVKPEGPSSFGLHRASNG
jgi:hypothetical protein